MSWLLLVWKVPRRDDGAVGEQAGLDFSGLLRQLRSEAGLTQEELAESAGVSQRAISDLERGINRTARNDKRAAAATASTRSVPPSGSGDSRGPTPRA